MTALQNATSDSCAFACHDTYTSSTKKTLQTNSYYLIAKKLGVNMRIDVVRTPPRAHEQPPRARHRQQPVPHGGLHHRRRTGGHGLHDICRSPRACRGQDGGAGVDLMTSPTATTTTTGHALRRHLDAANTPSRRPVTGRPSSPQKCCSSSWTASRTILSPTGSDRAPPRGGRCQEPLTISTCDTIKARGVKIAVLYTTYLAIPNNSWYNTYIAPCRSSIGTKMQTSRRRAIKRSRSDSQHHHRVERAVPESDRGLAFDELISPAHRGLACCAKPRTQIRPSSPRADG